MRKLLIFLIGIFGFVLIFSVSGLMAYYLFPDKEPEEVEHEYQDAAVPLGVGQQDKTPSDEAEGELTIVTPALNKEMSVVRRGGLDVVQITQPPTENVTEEGDNEEQEDETQNREPSGHGDRDQGGGNSGPGSSDRGEGQSGDNHPSGGQPTDGNGQPGGGQPHEEPVSPSGGESAPQPDTPGHTVITPGLNPDIQISPDGL